MFIIEKNKQRYIELNLSMYNIIDEAIEKKGDIQNMPNNNYFGGLILQSIKSKIATVTTSFRRTKQTNPLQ